MENGIYDQSSGTFYPLSRRADLDGCEIQALLRKHHRNSKLTCGCGLDGGVVLPLFPVQLPVSNGKFPESREKREKFTLSRESIEQHFSGCFLMLDGDDTEIERRRAVSILGPPSDSQSGGPGKVAGSANRFRTHYETFAAYARRVFSCGLADAYIEKNRSLQTHLNPRPKEVFAALDTAVTQFIFTNGQSGYEAAESWGYRLRFGLVCDPVVSEGLYCNLLNVCWWENGRLSISLSSIRPEAMAAAVDPLRIFDNHRVHPYFIFAVEDGSGCLQRVFFHTVAVSEEYLIPTDSGAEGAFAVSAIKTGVALFKPVLIDDMQRVLEYFGATLEGGAKWSYRPDFLAFWRRKERLTLLIRELRGFERDEKPEYDSHLDAKGTHFGCLRLSMPVNYKEVDGTKLIWRPDPIEPHTW